MATQKHPKINIFNFEDYRAYLKAYYQAKKKLSPSFSHRYIASRVGFSTGYFSRILSGQKNLTAKHIFAFADLLKLTKSETRYFEAMVLYNHGRNLSEKSLHYERMLRSRSSKSGTISKNQYEYYTCWYHSAIRSIIGIYTGEAELDPPQITELLTPAVSIKEVKKSLTLLAELGLIVKTGNKYRLKDKYIKSGDKPNEVAIRNFLRIISKLGYEAVDRFEPEERKISSVTLGVSRKCYSLISDKMSNFLEDIHQLIEADTDPDRVYQMNLQLFPLCESKGRKV